MTRLFTVLTRGFGMLVATLVTMAIPMAAQAQTGQVTGRVTFQDTGEALSSVQLSIEGTQLGVVSAADGTYTITGVPAGTHEVRAQRIGYQAQTQEDVTVSAGETTTVNFVLAQTVLALQEVVATGLVDPVEGARSPISVRAVTRERIPVSAAGGALQNLQGVMPGVTISRVDGSPGSEVDIQLRTPTSVSQAGSPLIVVDGVILGSATTSLDNYDIESMEVIRGAAAASLYGSRAAGGVISIRTNRGAGLDIGQTRFQVRSEYGGSQALRGDPVPTRHPYLVDDPENPTTYIDHDGNAVDRNGRVLPLGGPAVTFLENRFPGPVYDNFDNMYQGGTFQSHNFSLSQNGESTNFAVTANRYVESGVLEGHEGYDRNSFRVNMDHRFMDNMSLGVSMFHAREHREELNGISISGLTFLPPDINYGARDPDTGEYLRQPDPNVLSENPLWVANTREGDMWRLRTLANANLRWDPAYWISFSGNASYDRSDQKERDYTPKGVPNSLTSESETDGEISFENNLNDTFNFEGQVTLRRDFGPLNVRLTGRALLERDRNEQFDADGDNFLVKGVPDLDIAEDQSTGSSETEVRSSGYLADLALDYDGKYIFTILGRRDGSSLFGSENRWHNYYRLAAAWRMGEEDWFNVPNLDEFKLAYARGTAGGRPGFSYQYETWGSDLSKQTLGNRLLAPEHTVENEISLEAIAFGRIGLTAVYAWQTTSDQIIDLPLPAFTGYPTQWQNTGKVEGETVEIQLETQAVSTPNFAWNTVLMFDWSYATMTEWPNTCRNIAWRWWCEDTGLYEAWGSWFLDGFNQFDTHHNGVLLDHRDEFQMNDDGWIVWVGEGNNYWEGIEKGLWGTSTTIDGVPYGWGMPIWDRDENALIERQQIGDAALKNFGWSNNMQWGNWNLHAAFHAALGGEVADLEDRFKIFSNLHPAMDMTGKPDELKKPTLYYLTLEGGRGNNFNVLKADYLKLRTLSFNYRLTNERLSQIGLGRLGLESMTIGVIGRNLFTVTSCECVDPEQATNLNVGGGGTLGGARLPSTNWEYPNSRQFTAEVSVTF